MVTGQRDGPFLADHALVVGISHYPELAAEGVAADLSGPDSDALGVHDWLVDEDGGRLSPDNVVLIRTADCRIDENDPQPASQRIQQALEGLEERTRKRPGRRLYLYFSGHGFSPDLEEAAVFTAEASQVSPSHVYVNAWLRWFRKAQRFEQSVLWVDACMNYQQSVPVQPVPLRTQLGTAVPGPAFIAVAAQTKSALELPMADGAVHGVFTWTLLSGLRGGAADRRGRVTGESLQNYLHNAMAEFLPADVKKTAAVDLQPFVRADEGMEFARFASRPAYPVTLSIPAAAPGQQLRIWSGSPHRTVVDDRLTGPQWTGSLVRGLYLADVPGAGLRQGFQVTGAGDVQVTVATTGPPVVPSDGSELYSLQVDVANPATSVVVVDHEFQRVLTDTGQVVDTEAPGVYKVRTLFGRDLTTATEQVVLLDRDLVVAADGPTVPGPAALPAPAATSAAADRSAELLADGRTAASPGAAAGGSAVSVLARYALDGAPGDAAPVLPHPLAGLQVVDTAGRVVADLAAGDQAAGGSGTAGGAGWQQAVEPGVYALRQTLPRGAYEASVVVSPGWTTEVVLRRTTGLGGAWGVAQTTRDGVIPPDDAAVRMRRTGTSAAPADDDVVEGARLALVQGRDIFAGGRGGELRSWLLDHDDDPMAAVLGCHLLLRAMAGPSGLEGDRSALFDATVGRLRTLLTDDHPDVEALSLRCADPALRATRPFSAPPMLTAGWQLVVAASYDRPELVPAGTWARVHASIRIGPLFVWAADEPTRSAHARQLQQWVVGSGDPDGGSPPGEDAVPARAPAASAVPAMRAGGEPIPAALQDAARRLGIPAAAATGLWTARAASP